MRSRAMHPQLSTVRRKADWRYLHSVEMERLLHVAQVLGQLRLRLEGDDLRPAAKSVVQPVAVLAAMRTDIEHRPAIEMPAQHKSELGPLRTQAIAHHANPHPQTLEQFHLCDSFQLSVGKPFPATRMLSLPSPPHPCDVSTKKASRARIY